jgi:two-component system response regulator HydG
MIYGESGTGKELVARAIHAGSPRGDGPFVRVNCGALSESLLDSELFGHERGAFTGAERKRRGRFELADGGTLFLDEIATVPHTTQVRLLRVLQERELERVGGEETIPVDVRIIAATNSTADGLRVGGAFREDLFYRLHVIPLTLPPLRSRMEDIPLLVTHFIEKLAERTASPARAASSEAIRKLTEYAWPGNVRELENVIERALVLADGEELHADDIPSLGASPQGTPGSDIQNGDGPVELPLDGVDLNRAVEGMEERLLRQALERADGVKAEAARLLGLKPSALYYKLEKYGIDP